MLKRLHELIWKKWGSGLLDLVRLKLNFADMLHSGWPYFGMLSRLADQLKLDRVFEADAAKLFLEGSPEAVPRALLTGAAPTLCGAMGWTEDRGFLEVALAAVESGRPVPLELSLRAVSEGACIVHYSHLYKVFMYYIISYFNSMMHITIYDDIGYHNNM